MSAYEDYRVEVSEFADKLKEQGVDPKEVHNRFALLYLERMELKEEEYEPGEILDYLKTKLMVGTTFMAMLADPRAGVPPYLYYMQNWAKKQKWVLRHCELVKANTTRAVAIVTAAFTQTMGMPPRPCDIRICLQLGSPELWANAEIGDFVLSNNIAEMARLNAIEESVQLCLVMFTTELQKYIEEHMKYELTNDQRKNIVTNVRASLQ